MVCGVGYGLPSWSVKKYLSPLLWQLGILKGNSPMNKYWDFYISYLVRTHYHRKIRPCEECHARIRMMFDISLSTSRNGKTSRRTRNFVLIWTTSYSPTYTLIPKNIGDINNNSKLFKILKIIQIFNYIIWRH